MVSLHCPLAALNNPDLLPNWSREKARGDLIYWKLFLVLQVSIYGIRGIKGFWFHLQDSLFTPAHCCPWSCWELQGDVVLENCICSDPGGCRYATDELQKGGSKNSILNYTSATVLLISWKPLSYNNLDYSKLTGVQERHIRNFNLYQCPDPTTLAKEVNVMQGWCTFPPDTFRVKSVAC